MARTHWTPVLALALACGGTDAQPIAGPVDAPVAAVADAHVGNTAFTIDGMRRNDGVL